MLLRFALLQGDPGVTFDQSMAWYSIMPASICCLFAITVLHLMPCPCATTERERVVTCLLLYTLALVGWTIAFSESVQNAVTSKVMLAAVLLTVGLCVDLMLRFDVVKVPSFMTSQVRVFLCVLVFCLCVCARENAALRVSRPK